MSEELIVKIEKDFWPKGVVRGLNPELRKLGDANGNLVIAAQPAKGEIMIKGDAANIEKAKPGLRKLIQEFLPDAPMPDNLTEKAAKGSPKQAAKASPKSKPETSPKTKPAAAPKKEEKKQKTPPPPPKPKPVVILGTVPANPPAKKVVLRNDPRVPGAVAPDLLWQCLRGNSSFMRKQMKSVAPTSGPKRMRPTFSAEPCNLLGWHTRRYSGSVAAEALDVRPAKKRDSEKERVELVQSHAKTSRHRRPESTFVTRGLNKCAKKGLARIDLELDAKFYRSSMCALAKKKYLKVLQTFKKKKRTVKSRRASSDAD